MGAPPSVPQQPYPTETARGPRPPPAPPCPSSSPTSQGLRMALYWCVSCARWSLRCVARSPPAPLVLERNWKGAFAGQSPWRAAFLMPCAACVLPYASPGGLTGADRLQRRRHGVPETTGACEGLGLNGPAARGRCVRPPSRRTHRASPLSRRWMRGRHRG